MAQEGYKFLLRDAHSQLWVLLRRYIANAEQRSGAVLKNDRASFMAQLRAPVNSGFCIIRSAFTPSETVRAYAVA